MAMLSSRKFYLWSFVWLPMLVAFIAVACKLRNNAATVSDDATPANNNAEYTLEEYISDCEKELGTIPEISCLEGEIIPVRNSDLGTDATGLGKEITEKNHGGTGQKCDAPSLLREGDLTSSLLWRSLGLNQCVPYTRVARPQPAAGFDTQWVYTCRRYYTRTKDNIHFDDINMVGHNPKTGGTCFFVSSINRIVPTKDKDLGHDGTKVPSLTKKQLATKFWKTPREMTEVSAAAGGSEPCTSCHDNDAFIHSPYIDQVQVNGEPIVPVTSGPDAPYWLVGRKYFNGPKWQTKHLVSDAASNCTTCHRIGNRRTCEGFAGEAVSLIGNRYLSNKYDRGHWMPPPDDLKARFATADGDDLKAVKFIMDCCKNPNDKKCEWADHPKLTK